MTMTTLLIIILCIGVPILIVSKILIIKGQNEDRPLLPLLAAVLCFGFLVFSLYSIINYSEHQENQYVYYVLIDGNEYELTHDKNKIKIFTTGLFGSGTEKIQFYTDDGQFIESNNFTYKKILKDNNEKKAKQIAAEKADEMFPQPKMKPVLRNPTIIIPAYDEKFIDLHPELKKYFVREVSPQEIFSPKLKLNIDFRDGTWQLSVDEHTSERVKAQFSKDGKFVLVSGIKEGNSIINISREDEAYNFSIFVIVEEPEEWYEKLQEEIKLY